MHKHEGWAIGWKLVSIEVCMRFSFTSMDRMVMQMLLVASASSCVLAGWMISASLTLQRMMC